VQLQPKLQQPLPKFRQESVCVRQVLEPDDIIVGVPDDNDLALRALPAPDVHPQVEHIMQIDVPKQRLNHRTLRVPISVLFHSPSSMTPAFNHFWISRSTRRPATRCWTNFRSHSCDKLSKETTTHYPSSALPGTSDHYSSASSVSRTVSGGSATSTHASRIAFRSHSTGRKQIPDPRRLDRLQNPCQLSARLSSGGLAG
jgi:hypothetical protein